MSSVDYIIISLYLAAILLMGMYAGKGLNSLKEFAVSHRSYGTFLLP